MMSKKSAKIISFFLVVIVAFLLINGKRLYVEIFKPDISDINNLNICKMTIVRDNPINAKSRGIIVDEELIKDIKNRICNSQLITEKVRNKRNWYMKLTLQTEDNDSETLYFYYNAYTYSKNFEYKYQHYENNSLIVLIENY